MKNKFLQHVVYVHFLSNLSVPFGCCNLHSINMDGQAPSLEKSPPRLTDIGKMPRNRDAVPGLSYC